MTERPEILTPRARRLLPIFLLLLVAASVRTLWCGAPERSVLSGDTMGTTWAVTLNDPDLSREGLTTARGAIQARLDAVNATMSTWDPESELSRFNRHLSTAPFPLSVETLVVISLAADVSEKSGGAFDITVQPLVALWGFGAGARLPGEPPSETELDAVRARVGWTRLDVEPEEGQARKDTPGLTCDLSAIAKGFAVDEVANTLVALGHRNFLVEVGGEVRARGERTGGGPWRLAIERPEPGGRAVHAVVELDDVAMATSGDYRSFYEAGGQRRTHIIDPRTGRPVEHGLASVSVVHRTATLADAWATALMVVGPEQGPALAREQGLAAFFIWRGPDGHMLEQATPGFPPFKARADAADESPGAH